MPFICMMGAAVYSLFSGNWGGLAVALMLAFLLFFMIPAPESKR